MIMQGDDSVYSKSNLQKMMHSIMIISGALMQAYIFGNINSIIHNKNRRA